MQLGISDRNKMVLWTGCGGRAEFSLHTKNVRSAWFVVKRRGCSCNLSGGVALIVWFTTNGMCVKNNTIIYVERARNSKRDCEHDLYCCLLPRWEALRTSRSGFPIATKSFRKILAKTESSSVETFHQRAWLSLHKNTEVFWRKNLFPYNISLWRHKYAKHTHNSTKVYR